MINLKELSKMLELEGIKHRPMTNGNRAGLAIGDKTVMPVVYADRYDSIEEALKAAKDLNDMSEPLFAEVLADRITDPEYIKDHARLGIRPQADDGAMTQKYLDLELYVYVDLDATDQNRSMFSVHPEHIEMLGITWEELLQIATENMIYTSKTLMQVMKEILIEEGCPEYMVDMMTPKQEGPDMYVISTENRLRGASAMAVTNELYELADLLDSDLIIFPSSIHEIIVVPADNFDNAEKLREMVTEINATQVDENEKLSDNVYRFSRYSGEVTII